MSMDPPSILLGTAIGAIGAILGFSIWMIVSRRRASRNPTKLNLCRSIEEGLHGRYDRRAWNGSEKQRLKSSCGTPRTPKTLKTLETPTTIPQHAFHDDPTPPPTPPGLPIGLPTVPPTVQGTNFFRSSTSTCATEDHCYSSPTPDSMLVAQKSTPSCSASPSPYPSCSASPSIAASNMATAGSTVGSMKSTKSMKSVASVRTRSQINLSRLDTHIEDTINHVTSPTFRTSRASRVGTFSPASSFKWTPSIASPIDRYINSAVAAHRGPTESWSGMSAASDFDFGAKYSSTIFPDAGAWSDAGEALPDSPSIPGMPPMERVYVRR
ncbi:hypothetical protein FPQ18DRAFT_163356 [Pyronema domesticum]|nr:hypothetical protein FPQ18DRAFT_163356 [Pyronema domesticum]